MTRPDREHRTRDTDTGTAVYLTPIWRRLADAMQRAGLPHEVEVPLGRFGADFVIEGRIVVEADGAAYHDAATDAARDQELAAAGWPTLRFTGRQIVADTDAYDERIKQIARHTQRVSAFELPGLPLTDEPDRVVSHLNSPSLGVAPAGAGKTNTVVARIARLVHSSVVPEQICAVSFRNAAVLELRDRLVGIADDGTYKTVHSLAVFKTRGSTTNRSLTPIHSPWRRDRTGPNVSVALSCSVKGTASRRTRILPRP